MYLDTIEAYETGGVLHEAPKVEPGSDAVGGDLAHTVEGMQAGIVVGCADMFDDDASAISGRRSRGQSFDASIDGSKPDDSALDIPFVLAAAGEAAVSGIVRQAIADSIDLMLGTKLRDINFCHYIDEAPVSWIPMKSFPSSVSVPTWVPW